MSGMHERTHPDTAYIVHISASQPSFPSSTILLQVTLKPNAFVCPDRPKVNPSFSHVPWGNK